MSRLIFILIAIFNSYNAVADDCRRYYSGSITGIDDIQMILWYNGNRIYHSSYKYLSDIDKGSIKLATEENNLNRLFEQKRTDNYSYENTGNYFDILYSSKILKQGYWINGKSKEKHAFIAALNPNEKLLLSDKIVHGHSIKTFRRQLSLEEHLITVSIDDVEIPVVLGNCYRDFSGITITLLDKNKKLWHIHAQSWPQGNGSFSLIVNSIVSLKFKNNLLAWSSEESGSGGVSYYRGEDTQYRVDEDSLIILKRSKWVNGDASGLNVYKNQYDFINSQLILKKSTLEKYKHQEKAPFESINLKVDEGSKFKLIKENDEGFPGILYISEIPGKI